MRFLVVMLFLQGLAVLPLAAEFRTLVSSDGKAMKAELVSHSDGKVTIRREDGREFEVSPKIFCKQDQEAILAWMQEQPEKIEYRLRAAATKKNAGSSEVSASWVYEMTVRNDGQKAINGIKVLYRIPYESHGRQSMAEGELLLDQDLEFNRTMVINSDVISVSRGKNNRNSGVRGCLIRVLDPMGEVVLDWVSNEIRKKGVTWESLDPQDVQQPQSKIEIR